MKSAAKLRRRLAIGATVLASTVTCANASTDLHELLVLDARLQSVLGTLSKISGVSLDTSDAVRGRVRNQELTGGLDDILQSLSDTHRLAWFEFNGTFYVSMQSESVSRLVRLGNLDAANVGDMLHDSGIDTQVLNFNVAAEGEAVVLTGPPRLVALAEVMIESIPEEPIIEPRREPLKVITVRRGISETYQTLQANEEQTSPDDGTEQVN